MNHSLASGVSHVHSICLGSRNHLLTQNQNQNQNQLSMTKGQGHFCFPWLNIV